uniref:Uncharacterized protein n=1 Tax=Parascaris univalens TaxID=6257 RepID=A0A915C7V1_PARUN
VLFHNNSYLFTFNRILNNFPPPALPSRGLPRHFYVFQSEGKEPCNQNICVATSVKTFQTKMDDGGFAQRGFHFLTQKNLSKKRIFKRVRKLVLIKENYEFWNISSTPSLKACPTCRHSLCFSAIIRYARRRSTIS